MRKSSYINPKGFTLMELLLVLVILSIIVSMGLLVINIVRSNFDSLNKSNTSLIEIQDSDMKLSSFFFNSDTVFYNSETKTLSSNKEILYELKEENIVNVSNDEILFDSIFDLKMNIYKSDNNRDIVTCFHFSKQYESQLLPFSYCKQYDIATRIKYPLDKSLTIK